MLNETKWKSKATMNNNRTIIHTKSSLSIETIESEVVVCVCVCERKRVQCWYCIFLYNDFDWFVKWAHSLSLLTSLRTRIDSTLKCARGLCSIRRIVCLCARCVLNAKTAAANDDDLNIKVSDLINCHQVCHININFFMKKLLASIKIN